jgi:argininosuccinate lyase
MIREGRLGRNYDAEVARFTSSLKFDETLFEYDVLGSIAHCVMLHEKGIISREAASKVLGCLVELLEEGIALLKLGPEVEDIHLAIEEYLFSRIGEDAGRLHTGRSRNDQVATALRLWAREELNQTTVNLLGLCEALVDLGSKNASTLFPGYTHLQRAQATTLGHLLLAHCDSFLRDVERLEGAYDRTNLSPLGAGALATSSFPLDRELTAKLLGFRGLIENSADAVSARDFIHESLAALAVLMANLSRLCEELILWCTAEFGFAELKDEHASTSSIMPQKKNPDALELVRAKTCRVIGNLASALALQKALPLTYNRDLQELSPLLADSFNACNNSIRIVSKLLRGLSINASRASEACRKGYITATELAEFLVREKKLPFRKAHGIVGRAVQLAIAEKKQLDKEIVERAAEEMGIALKLKAGKIKSVLSPGKAVDIKRVTGGPSKAEISRMLKARKEHIRIKTKALEEREKNLKKAKKRLCGRVDRILEG